MLHRQDLYIVWHTIRYGSRLASFEIVTILFKDEKHYK